MEYGDGEVWDGSLDGEVLEFRNKRKVGLHVTIALVVSVFSILLIAVTFFLELLSRKSSSIMPGLIGGMSVIPIMGIWFAIWQLRQPVRILLYEQGLTVEWLVRSKELSWKDIGEFELKEVDFLWHGWMGFFAGKKKVSKECLVLFGRDRRKIAEIGGEMEGFDVLVKEIHSRSSQAQGESTFDVDKQTSQQVDSQKKKRIAMFFVGLFLVAMGVGFGITESVGEHNRRLLEKEGQVVEAVVSRHYKYNITPRIEYTFTDSDGRTYSENVMVESMYWESLEENGTVPIKYLPANPKNHRLAEGQVESMRVPFGLALVGSLVMTGLGVVCIGMYFFRISDIKFEDGRFIIVRTDEVKLSPAAAGLAEDVQEIDMDGYVTPLDIEEDVSLAEDIPSETSVISSSRELPGGLKAIGVLNIVFGGIGVIWNGVRMVLVFFLMTEPITFGENIQLTGNMALALGAHGFSMVMSLLFVISGIGILGFNNWGCIVATIGASGKLLLGLTEIVSTCLSDIEIGDSEQQYIFGLARGFIIFWVVLTMIYPAIAVVILQRKSTREVFRQMR